MTDGNDHKKRLREQFERLLARDEDEPPFPDGPVRNPVDRFAHIPEPTRAWIERLRAEDLEDLDKILLGFRRTSTIVWFFKWFCITMGGGFVATWAFGQKVLEAISYFKGVK